MRTIQRIAAIVACVSALAATVTAAGTVLVFSTIDVPGAVLTNAQGINAQGDVVGTYTDPAGVQHGFLWSGGRYRTIDVPNGHAVVARGINASGDIVGSYQRAGESGGVSVHGFLLTRRGGLLAVDYPGHLNTIAVRILDNGTIVGCYHDTDTMGTMHGMMFHRGFSAMDMGMSMNNGATPDGEYVVGLFTDTDGRVKAFVVNHGSFAALEVPGALSTVGEDVNPSRIVVGIYTDAAGAVHGFQHDGTAFRRIDAPGATVTRVFGVNVNGDVVGLFVDTAGHTHGFVAHATAQ